MPLQLCCCLPWLRRRLPNSQDPEVLTPAGGWSAGPRADGACEESVGGDLSPGAGGYEAAPATEPPAAPPPALIEPPAPAAAADEKEEFLCI
eukprot:TRINITY_DN22716_c0_g1_i1.p1 TRINITY_DN22716_c0_g1~~TRINITY_DN22716_c0_g1_i1.p1  ORF type:complete len:107 (+),score=34.72 TRINITY_DN22716_c0_g1_i1:46-321(+)